MIPSLFNYDQMANRIKVAKANKLLWEHHLRECYRYSMPERQTIDEFSKGQKKRQWVYDSTAIDSLEDYASTMESQLVPSWRKWFKLEPGAEIPEENIQEVEEYLDEATDIIFDHINHSNFNAQIKETFLDLGISTGALIVEEGDGIQSALNFRSVSLSEVILERSARGIPETVWREIKVSAGDVASVWPKAEITTALQGKIDKDPATEIVLIEGIAQDHKTKEFISLLMWPEQKEVLYEEKVEKSQWVIFRESTIPGEVYGRGRVMRALSDIKTLNKMVENYLRSLEWQAHPTFTSTDDGVTNPHTFGVRPGTVNAVGSNDRQNPTLQALQVGGNPQLLDYALKSYQDAIRSTLLSKPFGNIEETPVRSATEMSMRNAEQQSSQGSAAGRLQTELLERLIGNITHILMKAGKLQPMKIDGKMVTIKFTSPIARQQDSDEIMVVMQGMEMLSALPPEEVKIKVKTEEVPGYIIDKLGLPAMFKRSDAEQEQMIKQQQADMKAQMEAMQEQPNA